MAIFIWWKDHFPTIDLSVILTTYLSSIVMCLTAFEVMTAMLAGICILIVTIFQITFERNLWLHLTE